MSLQQDVFLIFSPKLYTSFANYFAKFDKTRLSGSGREVKPLDHNIFYDEKKCIINHTST